MSCRKKIGWRGPLRSPVSLMTGAWYLGVDCALKAAADRAKHSHTARVFVINAFAAMASEEHGQWQPLAARRGTLLDAKGRPLAVNVMYDGVYVYRPWMKDRDVDRAATLLSNQLGIERDEVLTIIRGATR